MSVASNDALELKVSNPPLSKRELTPLGLPKALILAIYCVFSTTCTLLVAVSNPFVELAVVGGAMSWTDLTRDEITKDLSGVGSMALSISYASMAIFGLLSDVIPFQVVASLAVLTNVYALIAVFFTSSTFMVKSGIIIGAQGLVFVMIFIYQAVNLFPKQFNVIGAVISMGCDLSYGVTTLLLIIVANTSASVKMCTGVLMGAIIILGIGVVVVTPAKWNVYANAQKYKAGFLSYEDYQSSKIKEKPEAGEKKSWNPLKGKTNVIAFNPESDPLYHSFTKQRQIYFNKHTMLFTCWYLLHYLRGKKLVQPFLNMILREKGLLYGIGPDKIKAMNNLWNILPALAGPIPNLGFAFLADKCGQIRAWWVLNIICSFLFVIIRYLPWNWMYCGAAIVVVENSLMFSLIPMFFGKQFGAHNITKPMAMMYLCMAGVAAIADAVQTKVTHAFFNGIYLRGTFMSIMVSLVSIIPITVLLFMPFPGPPGADYKDPATALKKKKKEQVEVPIAKVEQQS